MTDWWWGNWAGLEFGCGKITPHIIQILSISKMHIASAIDACIDVCPYFCVSVVTNVKSSHSGNMPRCSTTTWSSKSTRFQIWYKIVVTRRWLFSPASMDAIAFLGYSTTTEIKIKPCSMPSGPNEFTKDLNLYLE
jgi:hypothetical protein